MPVFLALGTNVGERADNLRAALRALRGVLTIDAMSDIYESDAVGYTAQPRFWNMVVRGRTALGARALLERVKRLEHELGRTPTFHMGPRLIDIDLLLHGDTRLDEPGITVPHPRMHERPFVLQPLSDIDAELELPHARARVAALLARCGTHTLQRVGRATEILGDAD